MYRQIKNFYRHIKYYNTTPSNLKHDDLFLVEFPKSGVTWLSFILANIIQQKSEPNFDVNFFNYTQVVADIHYSRHINLHTNKLPYRIIKSHANYNPFYNHVVVLIRNPFNVMTSYYSFLTSLKIVNMSFEDFIRHKNYGVNNWILHTESWLKKNRGGHRLYLIRYEDLKKDTLQTVSQLIEMLGWNIDSEIIKKAIVLSSFDEMKKLENKYSKNNPKYNLDFVRKGKLGAKMMKENDYNYIYTKTENLINEFWSDINFKEIITLQNETKNS